MPATARSGRTFVGALVDAVAGSRASSSPPTTRRARRSPTCTVAAGPARNSDRGAWCATSTSATVRALGIGARVVSMAQATAPCFDTANVLCLNNGRFRVELRFRRPNDMEGLGTDAGLRTNDSAVIWFFNAIEPRDADQGAQRLRRQQPLLGVLRGDHQRRAPPHGHRHADRQDQDLLQPARQGRRCRCRTPAPSPPVPEPRNARGSLRSDKEISHAIDRARPAGLHCWRPRRWPPPTAR